MEHKIGRKLELSRETIRELGSNDLTQVVGGGTQWPLTCHCPGGTTPETGATNSAPSTCICLETQSYMTCNVCC